MHAESETRFYQYKLAFNGNKNSNKFSDLTEAFKNIRAADFFLIWNNVADASVTKYQRIRSNNAEPCVESPLKGFYSLSVAFCYLLFASKSE